jgi:hypothetical protein
MPPALLTQPTAVLVWRSRSLAKVRGWTVAPSWNSTVLRNGPRVDAVLGQPDAEPIGGQVRSGSVPEEKPPGVLDEGRAPPPPFRGWLRREGSRPGQGLRPPRQRRRHSAGHVHASCGLRPDTAISPDQCAWSWSWHRRRHASRRRCRLLTLLLGSPPCEASAVGARRNAIKDPGLVQRDSKSIRDLPGHGGLRPFRASRPCSRLTKRARPPWVSPASLMAAARAEPLPVS